MSTSISDLPMDPAGGSAGNVVITASAPNNAPQAPPQVAQPVSQPSQVPPSIPTTAQNTAVQPMAPQTNENMIVDQGSISNLVSGLQQATMNGATQLPSRDIPVTSHHISQDPEIQQNYVPPADTQDYIDIEENDDTILDEYNQKVASADSVDNLYNEFQTPFLLGILFFLFQLPFFKKYMFQYLPALFLSDGNYNLYGFVTISVLFAFAYYSLSKSIIIFNRF
jgi:hypothetical protein